MSAPATVCATCHHEHQSPAYCGRGGGGCSCGRAVLVPIPEEHEYATADVETSWTCPFCRADNSVPGEGAVGSWMECSSCERDAFLTPDDLPHEGVLS